VTRFRCSNERLNRIHAMVTHTLRCVTLGGIQVDCPHRERLGYGGDGAASLLSMLTHFDCRRFYPHWLRHWRDEQRPDGGLPHTAPAPYRAGGGPVWCGFPLTAAWFHYLYYGDPAILREQYPSVRLWFDYVEAHTRDGLLRRWPDTAYRNWYLGDWLPPAPVDASDPESIDLVNNCFLAECFARAAAMAEVLERPAEAEAHRARSVALRRRIHEAFFHDGVYADGDQIDLAYPLLVGAVPAAHHAEVFRNLVCALGRSGAPRLGTGLVGTGVLFELLTAEGRSDLVAAMVDTDACPGWGHMLREGETTTREDWHWPAGLHSHIHNTFNQVLAWFVRGLVGLRPLATAPGFRRFLVRPQPAAGIDWAEAECRTPAGTIAVRWNNGGTFRLRLTVPEGAEAEVLLPDGSGRTFPAGEHECTSDAPRGG
jgi:alpha-L-rhamnosidase